MSRPLRIQFPGAAYHVICRGDDRKPVFHDESDRYRFLEILTQSLKTYSVALYCYVLMDNHFHFFVETPLGNLSEFMRHFNITYTSHYNRRHKRTGHLFQGRYKSILVEKDAYAVMLSRYIHLNPIHTKEYRSKSLQEQRLHLRSYPWSTLPGYIDKKKRVSMVVYHMVLGAYGGDMEKGRNAYWRAILGDVSQGLEIEEKIVGQSILGSEDFIDKYKGAVHGCTREVPSAHKVKGYKAKERIYQAIEKECGVREEGFVQTRGPVRQIIMELLYRYGGMKGPEIGALFGVDYSTVSRSRKRLREKMEQDGDVLRLFRSISERLS